ncbi:MAG: DUF4259 domain-containing protein [Syntrophomonadaceae bacterium]|jgi:hypothetical protein|nr:DUF4259 domain-containing protein [Syntrophomonadaceae bacterium]
MGAWGFKALESDAGLDVVDFLAENFPENNKLKLSEIISRMRGHLLGTDFDDIDFFYDNTAMALVELYFMFKDAGNLEHYEKLKNIKAFTADSESLEYLLKYLMDIKNEVPDEDGDREIVDLWRDSKEWENWNKHLGELIQRLNNEIN